MSKASILILLLMADKFSIINGQELKGILGDCNVKNNAYSISPYGFYKRINEESDKGFFFYFVVREEGNLLNYWFFPLSDRLIKNKKYELELVIKLDQEISDYKFKSLWFKFLNDEEIEEVTKKLKREKTNHMWLQGDGKLDLSIVNSTWTKIYAEYLAKGNEKWLVLGLMKEKDDNIISKYERKISRRKFFHKLFHFIRVIPLVMKFELYIEREYMENNEQQQIFTDHFPFRPIVRYDINCIYIKEKK